MRPLLATNIDASTAREGATFAHNSSSAWPAANRAAGMTLAAVVLPPEAPHAGYMVSPIIGVTALTGSASVSAVTIATIVRVPVPISCVPALIATAPSGVISQRADPPRPPPPHWLAAQPKPVLMGPAVLSPVGRRLSHPNSFDASSKYDRHIAFGASGGQFLMRN